MSLRTNPIKRAGDHAMAGVRQSAQRLLMLCLAGAVLGSGCQKLDDKAGGSAAPMDFGNVAPLPDGGTPVILETPPILLANGSTTTDPCTAVKAESMRIRETFCRSCHGPDGTQGQPLFNFVLDDDKLTTTTFVPSGLLFVAKGDPEHSELYQRVSLGLMPPGASDIANQSSIAPTISDVSVLREWIMCLGPQTTSTGGTGGRGGTGGSDDGRGGAMGTGGRNDDSQNGGTGGRTEEQENTGGATESGGAVGTGGATGRGGAMGTGGETDSGGATGSGGAADSGGAMGSGGATTRGGSTGTGGVPAGTGGVRGTGGVQATGGALGTGGGQGTGGRPGTNLVTNGNFANGETEWHVTVEAGIGVTHMITAGQFCVRLPINASATVGFPVDVGASFALAAGATYQFSYQVSSTSQAINFEAKVGGAILPYTDVADFMAEPVGANQLRTNTHLYTPSIASSTNGVALTITTGNTAATVCIDNVSVSSV